MDQLIYEGKAKDVYQTSDNEVLRMVYKNQATALNGKRMEEIPGKGSLNRQISNIIFTYLTNNGIKTHFIKNMSETEQLVKKTDIIPIEFVLRNVISGSFARKFNQIEGTKLLSPVLEYYYKSDALDDPVINESQIFALKFVTELEIIEIKKQILVINQLLVQLFKKINIDLIDFKLEFGRYHGAIILADEFSPDNARLWDTTTHDSLDKDIFRKEQGSIIPAYEEVLNRLKTEKGLTNV
ncbi:phosphoribosylaminoimidazolesuccinocarboxamide synthase [Dellaglioa algida]|uniref:Phosphoribosylaminoimidazole-succinocarboxamide synthase n=1 Tax=Dellaglioa algida TaxID=105612 RepID=A0A5C6MAV6_9LACO|nr:phosphoribosylaminoimidazolesuccinocarboxamide synthase [Dellaglioa algida]MDK1716568.1 phosphoribosylaminoimidazolesuccinocarboxamide synthase [Dellaglioa algida]MDK1719939.1 phosphoribosylaminoimidazolesuccinocarboxamide synthase [Dellaglioa algida]MDK1721510.1 phosphoribosylaminoimidazolesuccinocarboxamide synthase [Dellaglioa algida]MDK1723268.1 phosphoribosylaminoimidazolesuccinocarboxamide synthase [Dellaglioa algida]MDK1724902.1 phosphoribosylaminoimidazolesuccinocarboxamide synthase